MIPLWRMIRDRQRPSPPSPRAICRELLCAFEEGITNLHLTHQLEHFFVLIRGENGDWSGNDSPEARKLAGVARKRLWKLLVRHYAEQPAALAAALDGAPMWTLSRVVWGSQRMNNRPSKGVPFRNWGRIASTIIDACRESPSVMLPQLAALVSTPDGFLRTGGVERTSYKFAAEGTRTLFGDELAVLRLFDVASEFPPEGQEMLEAIKRALTASTANSTALEGE
jgi:hypothetical protein